MISGLFAAFAGILFALNYRQVHPFMGEALGLKGISAMVVGGMGNIWGAIAGGLIIGIAEVFSIRYFGADFVDISVFGLLLLILFVRPTGLFGGASARSARMSGYLEGILVLLAINIVFAYGAFLPIAAGQLNLGLAGFAAIGGYSSAYPQQQCSRSQPLLAIPLGGVAAGLVALVVAVPVLRTRGIYLALATFALGEIVQATILNLEVVGGAAGYPVTAFIRLPDDRVVCARCDRARLAAVRDPLRDRDHRGP